MMTMVETIRMPTRAQLRILECKMEDLTDRQTATFLNLAPTTVRTQMSHVLRRLHVHSAAGAVVLCLRRGWLRL